MGGNATSLADSTGNPSGALVADSEAYGGNGGGALMAGRGNGGAGGNANATATGHISNGDYQITAKAYGGNGGNGGDTVGAIGAGAG